MSQVGKPYIFHENNKSPETEQINKSLPAQQKESNLCITFQVLHMPQLSPPLKRRTDIDSGLTSFFIQSLFPCSHFCLRLSFPCLFSGVSCYIAIVTK